MEFTTTIKPDTFSNSSIIFDWIKEDRAYYSKDCKTWNKFPIALLPHLSNLEGLWFKAEHKAKPPKFKLGDKVVAYDGTHKRTVGEVVSITTEYNRHSYEVGLPGQSVVADEQNVKMFEGKTFKVGDTVRFRLPGWERTNSVANVIEAYRNGNYRVSFEDGAKYTVGPEALTLEPKFKVGDRVTVVTPEHYLQGRSGKIIHVHKHNVFSVEFEEGRCVLVNECSLAPASKFKVGDRVTMHAPMHSRDGETGNIVWVWDRNRCSVRFDGHSCTNTVDINSLAIAGQTELNPLKWAEGLIKQLPQTHDGRNSWLMNYGSKEEVITDPEAVAQLVGNKAKILIVDANGYRAVCETPNLDFIREYMELGATFTWIRRP